MSTVADDTASASINYIVDSLALTPAMARGLESVDDQGKLRVTRQTARKLVGGGLAKPCGLGVAITHAGWNVLAELPLPTRHQIRYSHGRLGRHDMNGQFRPFDGPMVYSAWCCCGEFRHDGLDAAGRRDAVKQHKVAESSGGR